ncbi:uncharacterized protein LAJ45_08156 [Morchella importuna]|uniref:uncharacterized protein n=1 Tax=Morchella importuna TaxID=1174673 RepID=UPI001E8ED34A|nr:uncharacterized protein LAJ45_08156 [Morchella importuna]KAH8147692.1 hypothetical protein LAJ45_08156 [Morchella importuna]
MGRLALQRPQRWTGRLGSVERYLPPIPHIARPDLASLLAVPFCPNCCLSWLPGYLLSAFVESALREREVSNFPVEQLTPNPEDFHTQPLISPSLLLRHKNSFFSFFSLFYSSLPPAPPPQHTPVESCGQLLLYLLFTRCASDRTQPNPHPSFDYSVE